MSALLVDAVAAATVAVQRGEVGALAWLVRCRELLGAELESRRKFSGRGAA